MMPPLHTKKRWMRRRGRRRRRRQKRRRKEKEEEGGYWGKSRLRVTSIKIAKLGLPIFFPLSKKKKPRENRISALGLWKVI